MHACLYFCMLFLFFIYILSFLRDQISRSFSLVVIRILLCSFSFHVLYYVTFLTYAVFYIQCLVGRRENTETWSSSLVFDLLLWLWDV